MTIAEIHRLPVSEKIQIMEAIWEDLSAQAGSVRVPDWHKKLLDARHLAVSEGHEKIYDWDAVKNSLGVKQV